MIKNNIIPFLLIPCFCLDFVTCSPITQETFDNFKREIRQEFEEKLATRDQTIGYLKNEQVEHKHKIQVLESEVEILKSSNNNVHQDIDTLENQYLEHNKITKFAGVIETCAELPSYGVTNSDFYFIDPDGKGVNEVPIKAWCDIDENSTWVGKKLEIDVDQCGSIGCFSYVIPYEAPIKQMLRLMEISGNCHQELEFECLSSPLKVTLCPFSKCKVMMPQENNNLKCN